MDISVVIPSYNTQDTLDDTLSCLVAQQGDLDFEIIVVDCSEHNYVARVANQYDKVRYEHRRERFNPGTGRNIGADLASGDLLIFIDADVQLSPTSLESAWQHYQQGLEIFGGALELNTRTSRGMASYLEHFFFNHESQRNRPACERNNLSSALMCFKRSVFLEAGGFKDIPRMQDTELTERLRTRGYRLHFCPDVLAYQTQDAPFGKVLRKIFINGQNVYYIRYQANISMGKKCVFFALLPVISLAKVLRIIGRHLRYHNTRDRLRALWLTPALCLGGIYWMTGFYHALITEQGISKTR